MSIFMTIGQSEQKFQIEKFAGGGGKGKRALLWLNEWRYDENSKEQICSQFLACSECQVGLFFVSHHLQNFTGEILFMLSKCYENWHAN